MNLLIKVYRPCKYYPTGGRISQYLDNIKIGDYIHIKYPYGKCAFFGKGQFYFK
jgi:ferredoxin-NADP reductase